MFNNVFNLVIIFQFKASYYMKSVVYNQGDSYWDLLGGDTI
jgi:hypothetical protein